MQAIHLQSKLDADIASARDICTEAPYIPQAGDELAKDGYENVQVLGDQAVDNFNRLMAAVTEWVSPEQGCAYCHGDDDDFVSDHPYTKVASRKMLIMNRAVNAEWSGHVAPAGVNCHTCRQGRNVPSGIWFQETPVLKAVAGWGAIQNQPLVLSISTSLPGDALETFLLDDCNIKVHDLEPRVPNEGTASIQDAERTDFLMNRFSNSFGQNCVFRRNSRAFHDRGQVTPQWATALLGIETVREINTVHLMPPGDILSENRLGPLVGDPPEAACLACHKGVGKPPLGADMMSDWPELTVLDGPPLYERRTRQPGPAPPDRRRGACRTTARQPDSPMAAHRGRWEKDPPHDLSSRSPCHAAARRGVLPRRSKAPA